MKCPHCQENFHAKSHEYFLPQDRESHYKIDYTLCAACLRSIFTLVKFNVAKSVDGKKEIAIPTDSYLIYPKTASRPPPAELAADYKEACLVLADSAKASAALSRRCLQSLLRDHAGFAAKDLVRQIQDALDSGKLPSHLADGLDAVRNIGNFAAHPIKSQHSGEILDVEPGEAEWTLDVLEGLFDFYFVQPAKLKAKRDELNAKLAAAGKPAMK